MDSCVTRVVKVDISDLVSIARCGREKRPLLVDPTTGEGPGVLISTETMQKVMHCVRANQKRARFVYSDGHLRISAYLSLCPKLLQEILFKNVTEKASR